MRAKNIYGTTFLKLIPRNFKFYSWTLPALIYSTCLDAMHNDYNLAPCPLAFCILISHREEFVSPEQGNTTSDALPAPN